MINLSEIKGCIWVDFTTYLTRGGAPKGFDAIPYGQCDDVNYRVCSCNCQ